MGLSQSLFSAISGLTNHQRAMDNIGNNMANVNTVAFKKGVFHFETLLEQSLRGGSAADPNTGRGATNPLALGLGTQTGSINKEFVQGSIDVTGNQQDMAIEGNGYFVLRNGNNYVYTRDGSFYLGSDGSLLGADGLQVQGVVADEGVVPDTGTVADLSIPLGQTGAAVETTKVSFTGNLNSDQEIATGLRLSSLASPGADRANGTYGTYEAYDAWTFTGNNWASRDTLYARIEGASTAAVISVYTDTGFTAGLATSGTFDLSSSSTIQFTQAGYEATVLYDGSSAAVGGQLILTPSNAIDLMSYFGDEKVTDLDTSWRALQGVSNYDKLVNGGTVITSAPLGREVVDSSGNVNIYPAVYETDTLGTLTTYNTLDLADFYYLDGQTWVQPFSNIDDPAQPKEIEISFKKGGRTHNVTFKYDATVDSTTLADLMQLLAGGLDETATVASIADVQSSINNDLTGGVMGTVNLAGKVSTNIEGGIAPYSSPVETAGAFSRTGVDNLTPYYLAFTDSGTQSNNLEWRVTGDGFSTQENWYYQITTAGTVNIYNGPIGTVGSQIVASTTATGDTATTGATATFAGVGGAFPAVDYTGELIVSNDLTDFSTEITGLLTAGGLSENLSIVSNLGPENAISDLTFTYNNVRYDDVFDPDQDYGQEQGGYASTNLVVYDSLGNAKNANLQMTLVDRDSNFSTWRWIADSQDDTDNEWQVNSSGVITSNVGIGTGLIRFDSLGRFVNGTELSETRGLEITLENQGVRDRIQISLLEGLSSTAEQDLDFSYLTQVASTTDFNLRDQDGSAPGTLDSFTTSPDGVIQGVFSNGQVQAIGRVSLALIPNEAGMIHDGGNIFLEGAASGEAQIGFAGVGGRGEVRSGALEGSNVELSGEFTKLITTQRGFQGNARVVSTSDEMLVELVNMKR